MVFGFGDGVFGTKVHAHSSLGPQANFAHSGTPSDQTATTGPRASALQAWPSFNSGMGNMTLEIDMKSTPVSGLRDNICDFWDTIHTVPYTQ